MKDGGGFVILLPEINGQDKAAEQQQEEIDIKWRHNLFFLLSIFYKSRVSGSS
jgi:hypothetical protein